MFEESSFRDPVSQVVKENHKVKRLIYHSYYKEYNHLMDSGLYSELFQRDLIISHVEEHRNGVVIRIEPEQIPFISYPSEWCFSMLKEAALATLLINDIALQHGMMLKDASAFNMQYHNGHMKLIDTASFMLYERGMGWGAYRQFCQHFLYPLLCMSKLGFNPWQGNLEGITASDTAKIMPNRYHFMPSYLAHLYAQSLKVAVDGQKTMKYPPVALFALLNHLGKFVESIYYKPKSSWTQYADAGSYTENAENHKKKVFLQWISSLPEGKTADLGANLGYFSSACKIIGHNVVAVDSDHDCVEYIYSHDSGILPLRVDLCNPTPAIGWNNTERKSFLSRLDADTVIALALIHHLCIGNNVPLQKVAEMLAGHCKKHLIIEFVPPEDKQALKLRGSKQIPEYNFIEFLRAFGLYFDITDKAEIADSKRILFLMEKK